MRVSACLEGLVENSGLIQRKSAGRRIGILDRMLRRAAETPFNLVFEARP